MTRVSTLRAVLFDWDGTLADTAEASFRCYVRMFGDYGIPFDRETYARTYSPNWHHTYRCLGFDEARWSEADAKWLTYLAEETVQLIDGAREALEALERRNIARGIVTSGTRERIMRELRHHDVDRHFQHVICGTDVGQKKPHPEALHLCLDRMGVTPEQTAYVGDSPEDVQMARAAGVLAVAVRGSYPNADALLAASPDLIVDSVCDAVDQLLRSDEK